MSFLFSAWRVGQPTLVSGSQSTDCAELHGASPSGETCLQQGLQQQPNCLDKLVQEKLIWLSFSMFINLYFNK